MGHYKSRLAIDQRCVRQAGSPQTIQKQQISTYSALAISTGIQPKGSPRKSVTSPGHDHANALIRKLIDDLYNGIIEELSFIDTHYRTSGSLIFKDFAVR
jgi:hypothetical protein